VLRFAEGCLLGHPCIGTTPHVNTELVVATEELPEKFSLLLGASSS
jgi:hypothetical protein